MKNHIYTLLIQLILLVVSFTGVAQSNMVLLSGTVQGKGHTELSIYQLKNSRKQKLITYFKDSVDTNFAFAFPAEDSAQYSLTATTMKKGHRRLEPVTSASVPLSVKAGQDLSVVVNTLLLNKKGAFTVRPVTGKTNTALITGALLNWKFGNELTLSRVVDGVMQPVSSFTVQRGDVQHFSFAIPVKEEGFYTISNSRWQTRIYLKPGDILEIDIDGKSGAPVLLNGSAENKLHAKWQQLIVPITNYGYNRGMIAIDTIALEQYISNYQQLQPSVTAFMSAATTTNRKFDQLMQQAMKIDNEFAPIRFLHTLTSKRKKGIFISEVKSLNDVPLFYQQFISNQKFSNATSLQVPEFIPFMNLYAMLQEALLPADKKQLLTSDEKLKLMMDVIANDTLKAILLNEKLVTIELNNLTEFKRTFEPYKQFAKTKAIKEKYNEVRAQFISDTAFVGKSSYNFSLPDTSGKMVSMKDFKGKVVFIDVWATWCGPCKEQFPHMKTIEEEYKDNPNIVFVGISLDRNKDKEKWLAMIRKEKLVGVQLLDDIGLAFGRKYEIVGIPRFLLIDKQGKWIEVRCPRPSSKEDLKRYIDQALQQNAL
jgi:thiol-disulfide isomerase/thioredoxin